MRVCKEPKKVKCIICGKTIIAKSSLKKYCDKCYKHRALVSMIKSNDKKKEIKD